MQATRGPESPAVQSPAVQAYVLGGFKVVVRGQVLPEQVWRRKTARQLFKILLSRPNRRMTRDEVIELLWPESDPEAASSNLRSTLFALRHALEPSTAPAGVAVVFSNRAGVWLRPDVELWVDADAFEHTVEEAWRSADPLPLLEEASSFYAGHYLPEDLYEDWATERRESLKQRWAELQLRLSHELEHRGDPESAVRPLQRLLQVDPCDERAAQEAMQLLNRHGRRAEALRIYQRLVEALKEELGVEPSEATTELHRQVSAGENAAATPIPSAPFRCAYPFPSPAELIDREQELAALSRVVKNGRSSGQVALLSAPAGTGKSTLLGEMVRRAQVQGVLCLAGGCYEAGVVIPLGPFHDAFVDYFSTQPAERLRLGENIKDLARAIPELRYQLDLADEPSHESPQADRARVFAAVHASLRSMAEQGPVLLCLEDLHAADEASVHLFHYLARQTRRLPLALIGTFRSDEVPPDQPLAQILAALARERLTEHIRLSSFDRAATNRFIDSLLGGPSSERLAESVFSTTGGNPLFVEQLVLASTESGQFQRRSSIWHGTADVANPPQVVRDVIVQRVLRLSSTCRDALAMAAVLGQTFDYGVLLTALDSVDEPTLLVDLDKAIAASVLQETTQGYAFRHALLHQAMYWSVSTPQRMLLHTRAGEVLERLGGSKRADSVMELARHFVLAGRAPALREKALRYSLEAGHRADAASTNREALVHFTNVVEILETLDSPVNPSSYVEGLEGRARAERRLGLWTAAIDTSRSILELTEDPMVRARARAEIASSLNHVGEPTAALQEADLGLAELGAGPTGTASDVVRSHLLALKAYGRFFEGRFAQLLEVGDDMYAAADALQQPRLQAAAKSVRGWARMGQGRVPEALEEFALALQSAQQSGDKIEIAMAEVNLGVQNYLGGQFAVARDQLMRGAATFRDSAGELRMVNAIQHLGRVCVAEGNLEEARTQAEFALELATSQHDRWAADCHDLLGTISALRAEYEDAEISHNTALQIRTAVGFRAGIVDSLIALGLVEKLRGDFTSAQHYFGEASSTADEMDVSPQRVAARRNLGQLFLLMGNSMAAADVISGAFSLAESMSHTLEYAPTALAMAQVNAQAGDSTLALELAEMAVNSSRSAEHIVESNVFVTSLLCSLGDVARAAPRAEQATHHAELMQAPRLLGLAYLGTARLAFAQGLINTAAQHYAGAVRQFELARTPTERALAEGEYLGCLKGERPHMTQ